MTAMRPETTLEHIARDMREGRFPERSEPQMVANLAAPERIWAWAWQTVPMGQWGVTPSPSSVEYIRADLAAVQPAQVRVKPLVWGADPEVPDCINAGNYDIYLEDDGYQLYFWSVICGGPHRSLVDAQAAGEAHNKSAILAALEPQPDPRDEVTARLVEAATDANQALVDAAEEIAELRLAMSKQDLELPWIGDAIDKLTLSLAAAKAVQK